MVNLPNPLIAEDEISLSKTGAYEVVKLTAGVHRQTWVSGVAIFVDVHISNSSEKVVRKVELALEKATLFFPFVSPSTRVENADYLRLPYRTDKEIIVRGAIKRGQHGWHGVLPHSQETRTCYLEIPRGIATIDTGESFTCTMCYEHFLKSKECVHETCTKTPDDCDSVSSFFSINIKSTRMVDRCR